MIPCDNEACMIKLESMGVLQLMLLRKTYRSREFLKLLSGHFVSIQCLNIKCTTYYCQQNSNRVSLHAPTSPSSLLLHAELKPTEVPLPNAWNYSLHTPIL